MRCDAFLTAICSGGAWARLRARRHAAHCERCAAEVDRFERLREELTRTPVVTETHRVLWSRAAEQTPHHVQPMSRSPSATRQVRWAQATAAVLVVAACVFLITRQDWQPEVVAVKQPEGAAVQETSKQTDLPKLRQLEQSLDELAQELRQLGREAELLDARRELDRLATIYRPLGPADSPAAISN